MNTHSIGVAVVVALTVVLGIPAGLLIDMTVMEWLIPRIGVIPAALTTMAAGIGLLGYVLSRWPDA